MGEKKPVRSFWSRVDEAGEFMELSVRIIHGILFAFLLGSLGMWAGNHLWLGLGLLLFIAASPVGFVIGFFWLEVRFFLRLLLSFFLGS
ncbi:MAG: hypothetical protein V4599_12040 [Verrucomicrobiota bacterium]